MGRGRIACRSRFREGHPKHVSAVCGRSALRLSVVLCVAGQAPRPRCLSCCVPSEQGAVCSLCARHIEGDALDCLATAVWVRWEQHHEGVLLAR